MGYDFDTIINRYDTDSLKYDLAERRGMPKDILPLWVADMDFQVPKEVIDALVDKSQHGIFGYSDGRDDYDKAVLRWFKTYFNWEIERAWMIKTPGVVYAVTQAIHAFTNEGDGVLIQEPVYYPFKESIKINNRKVVINELIYKDYHYSIDLNDFEMKIVEGAVKLFILCSPHNPVGRVWTKDELSGMAEICLKHDVVIVSDEIHGDFTYEGFEHQVLANIDERYADITVTCTAPSKTFNLAALQLSNVFISNRTKRHAFKAAMAKSGYSQPNIMGLVATQAAYTYGHEWLKELKTYLADNLSFMRKYLQENIPGAVLVEPQGMYLVWVDVSGIETFKGLSSKEIDEFMVQKANLWLDGGTMFGAGGEGFQRFNIACPRAILKKALDQWAAAINEA